MTGIVTIEGKPISLDNEIINAGPGAIRAALCVDFPDIENADIQVQSTGSGARVFSSATVVKRAAPKG
jgi:hypothetical protein